MLSISNLVEWIYDFNKKTLLIKSMLLTEVSNIEIGVSKRFNYALQFKVGDISHEINLKTHMIKIHALTIGYAFTSIYQEHYKEKVEFGI